MFEKLETVEKRYEELTNMISDPEVISNHTEWQKLMKEHASIEEIVLKFREYKKVKQEMCDGYCVYAKMTPHFDKTSAGACVLCPLKNYKE